VVQVNDAAGAPMVNAAVTWTTTEQGAAQQPAASTTMTNNLGQASYEFQIVPFQAVEFFYSSTVVAAALNTSVTFTETTATPGTTPAVATVSLIPAGTPPTLSGVGGQTASTSIVVSLVGTNGTGAIPNIQVTLKSETAGLTISCATEAGQEPGTILTNNSGTATCNPVFGNKLGTGTYEVIVGNNFETFGPATFSVIPGPPSLINIFSGNNQTVNAGALAPASLIAQVTDAGGNPSAGAPVSWSVTAGTATLSNTVSSSLAPYGYVSTWITPTAGPVNVTVRLAANSSVQAVFTVNVNEVITTMQTISGDGQQALEGAAFASPLIVQVNDNTAPVPGATVSFAVTSGSATLSAASATTNAQGQAQVTATAGVTSGPVVITASAKSGSSTYSQTFNLIVNPPGATITAVVNAAGFQNQFVSPCSLATIYGTGLAPALQGVASATIAPQTQVAGITVQFGGVLAPILWVANVNGQQSASVQVPCDVPSSSALPPATVPMVVTVNNVASQPFAVTVLPASPGIFQFTDSDGKMRAVLIRPDGSFASVTNPAAPGEIVRMFVTGLGQTTPALFTNELDPLVLDSSNNWVPQTLTVVDPVIVGVDNGGVLVVSSTYSYDMVGVYQVDFQVPQNAAANNDSPFAIVLYEGTNVVYGNPSLIAIQ
jgi:uncharacterized protein (TIGR03437 family)